VLELQSDFGALLRQAALFENVRKLIVLANSHQKLRLGQQGLRFHAILFQRRGQRCEVHVRRDVLLAWGLVRIGSGGVVTICHQSSAMPARKLLLTSIAIVNRDEDAST